jgi:hypothetical protein
VKKCRDAIDRAIPRIKESYERSLMAVANGLSAILGTVAPVDNKVLSNMNNLAEMAATLWLKIGTQRFRVVVVISDETKTSTQGGKGRAGQRDPQELVVQPGLRRIGNSHGENLNIEQFIPDCKGTFTNFQSG